MILVICLDDKGGYSFASRRQSRDRIQIDKMLKAVGESRLLLSDYSAGLFDVMPNNVTVCENPLQSAQKDDFCFVENIDINIDSGLVDKLIIYRWNRSYPADKKLPNELLCGRKLMSSVDFKGHSHEIITEEVYI